ncbi:MAG: sigma-70 family RNA polymerase sigma factor [Acutalibacteraceae bacterium]|jgi:RNA polymerase sporulation-specific sigma factor
MRKEFVGNYENMSDDEIVSLIKSGNLEPIGTLINRYYPTILMYVNQLCPAEWREDAVQEATFALYSAIKGYNREKSSFPTFADLCIKRSVIAYLKAQNRKKVIPSQLVSPIDEVVLADCNSPEKIFFDRNDYEVLTDTIKLELSSLEYKVLQLYLSGYKYAAIAGILDISEKSVSNALLRIRKKLKQQ